MRPHHNGEGAGWKIVADKELEEDMHNLIN